MASVHGLTLDSKGRPVEVAEIRTSAGTPIYLLPVETFPGHLNNLYLIAHPDHPTLFDTGTSSCNAMLDRRLTEARDRFDMHVELADLAHAVISHAHIDHYGNAHRLRDLGVPIAIHELDAPVLDHFDERFLVAVDELSLFLARCGISEERADRLMEMYREGKRLFTDLAPDRELADGDTIGPGWRVIHVPGHSPGQICLVVDDVVLTGDHVLARTTPIQTPRSLALLGGLARYLYSLDTLRAAGPFALGLGAHEAPIEDVTVRIDEIVVHHDKRLEEVSARCHEQPVTVAQVSRAQFGRQRGYGVILALLETAAHLEHLLNAGRIRIVNSEEVARGTTTAERYLASASRARLR